MASLAAPRLLVSAAHKSSGKTTVALGLCAALRARGLAVQPFKKGPDYIDPLWLGAASGLACRTLDLHLCPAGEVRDTFLRHAAGADVCVVEGNKGLHDGMALDGRDSSAAVAVLLGLPVILAIDARGMTRGIAPLLLGLQAFDRSVRIAGTILNRVGGARHESKLRAAIERYTDVPVLGALHADAALAIDEAHLGLVPGNEAADAQGTIARIAAAVADGVDLDTLLCVARSAPRFDQVARSRPDAPARRRPSSPALRIGIARDRAFGFYYPDDLDALERAGAVLVPFDTLRDASLPAVDALFIGGGFPERWARELAANDSLRSEIRAALDAGLPAYAECGGLMYLARSLTWRGEQVPMVGAIPADAVMHERPVGRGYVELDETAAMPWPARAAGAPPLRAHEFHHSSLENVAPGLAYAYDVTRGHGVDGRRDGVVVGNLVASYAHLRGTAGSDWPERFVAFARARRDDARHAAPGRVAGARP
ncbi:MAG: cobyrinate a,c-diamide synthase [Betaproteobacteria bacterium]|nr:cobyrinate a,c-diamide synthase [Betaproteobacteria bacterium]